MFNNESLNSLFPYLIFSLYAPLYWERHYKIRSDIISNTLLLKIYLCNLLRNFNYPFLYSVYVISVTSDDIDQ